MYNLKYIFHLLDIANFHFILCWARSRCLFNTQIASYTFILSLLWYTSPPWDILQSTYTSLYPDVFVLSIQMSTLLSPPNLYAYQPQPISQLVRRHSILQCQTTHPPYRHHVIPSVSNYTPTVPSSCHPFSVKLHIHRTVIMSSLQCQTTHPPYRHHVISLQLCQVYFFQCSGLTIIVYDTPDTPGECYLLCTVKTPWK